MQAADVIIYLLDASGETVEDIRLQLSEMKGLGQQ